MFSRLGRRLTYANIVSTLALFLVLSGGTAVALSGSNTVFSDDITNGEVKNGDVGANAIKGGKVTNNSLTGSDVTDLTGGDIDESSLARVPRAASADNASADTVLSAVVELNGSLARATQPGTSSRAIPDSPGVYEVLFPRDVRDCTHTASLGTPNFGTTVGQVATSLSDPREGVAVRTSSSAGALEGRSFHLTVVC